MSTTRKKTTGGAPQWDAVSLDPATLSALYEAVCRQVGRRTITIPQSFLSDMRRWARLIAKFSMPPTEPLEPIENEEDLVTMLLIPGKERWTRERHHSRRSVSKGSAAKKTGRPRNRLEIDAALCLAVIFHEYFHRRPTHGPFKEFGKAAFEAAGWKKPPTAALREAIERWETSYHFDKGALRRLLFGYRKGRRISWRKRG